MEFADLETRARWQRLVQTQFDRLLPRDRRSYHRARVWIVRVIAVANIALGINYFFYRYTASINVNALWFAIPLLAAETYSFIDTLLFILMMWKPKYRESPPPLPDATVDVFITTYAEPVELVRETAEAAVAIRHPHTTYVLDDGNRAEVRAMCAALGCEYITRGPEWEGRPRHAKAGNVNNALNQTFGEFVLILDADQIPDPRILDRTLGYFRDPEIAFVQTPQYFYNVPLDDPFGSQAPLFYGPIQQGKDGWNAAFFCGSNAVLRREALFQLGLITYVTELERQIHTFISQIPIQATSPHIPRVYRKTAHEVTSAAERAADDLRNDVPLQQVLQTFNTAIRQAQRQIVALDMASIEQDLLDMDLPGPDEDAAEDDFEARLDQLAEMIAPPPEVFGLSADLLDVLKMDTHEVLDIQPLVTFSITEDMATSMRLHALGWKSVFHHEILARGLAPEDLGSMLGQRLRWGAGTIQVLVKENPLVKPGLSLAQRLQYFTTMYSYFSGFFAVVYLLAPVIYSLTGISPVVSYSGDFLIRIIPYLLVNKLLFFFVAWKLDTSRGAQYSLALFPLWIQAVLTVFSGEKLTFKVTPKTRQSGIYLNMVIPQLAIVILLAFSSLYALASLGLGWRSDTVGVVVNVFWSLYNIRMLRVILSAAVYQGEAQLAS